MKLRVKPVGDPALTQDPYQKFGNWTGQDDTRVMAQDLMKRGLIGADQLLSSNPNPNDPNSIRNAQGDWKVNAIQSILAKARELNLRKPEEVNANRNVLMGKLNSQYRDAINSQSFNTIHPNFWSVITNSLLPDQYAKEDAQKMVAKN